jgi:hypothetical protein
VQITQLDLLALHLGLHGEVHILLYFEGFAQFLFFSALALIFTFDFGQPTLQNHHLLVQDVPR